MKIGVLSDTHGFLDPSVFKYFESCDEIWHAGDIGSLEVADELERHKPLRAVYGNIDGRELRERYPEDLQFACDNMHILISHIGGRPSSYNKRIRNLISAQKPDIIVCGHSHILQVIYDKVNSLLYLNPGAIGRQGFHKVRTALRFDIIGGKVKNMEVIELGKRA